MRQVYKYPIRPNATKDSVFPIEIRAPKGAKPIFVGVQRGQPCVWVEVETTNELVVQEILVVVGTGWGMIPVGYFHFQSVLEAEGALVWHFYRKAEDENDQDSLVHNNLRGLPPVG